jgi:hypothetical protein
MQLAMEEHPQQKVVFRQPVEKRKGLLIKESKRGDLNRQNRV